MPGRGQRHDLRGVPVIVVENVQDYRECVAHYVTRDDVVLEAGAAQGCTTHVISQFAREVVGIDKSPFNAKVACERHPHIPFCEMDAGDISGIQRLGKQWTKIFLDISGSQPIGPLASLLEKYERAFPSVNLFVVKSYRLKKLVGLSSVFPEEVLGTTRNSSAKYMLKNVNNDGQGDKPNGAHAASQQRLRHGRGLAAAIMHVCVPACAAVAAFGVGLLVGSRRRVKR